MITITENGIFENDEPIVTWDLPAGVTFHMKKWYDNSENPEEVPLPHVETGYYCVIIGGNNRFCSNVNCEDKDKAFCGYFAYRGKRVNNPRWIELNQHKVTADKDPLHPVMITDYEYDHTWDPDNMLTVGELMDIIRNLDWRTPVSVNGGAVYNIDVEENEVVLDAIPCSPGYDDDEYGDDEW